MGRNILRYTVGPLGSRGNKNICVFSPFKLIWWTCWQIVAYLQISLVSCLLHSFVMTQHVFPTKPHPLQKQPIQRMRKNPKTEMHRVKWPNLIELCGPRAQTTTPVEKNIICLGPLWSPTQITPDREPHSACVCVCVMKPCPSPSSSVSLFFISQTLSTKCASWPAFLTDHGASHFLSLSLPSSWLTLSLADLRPSVSNSRL